jgi:alginate O-acetyltransferase complex protein AlgJ
MFSPSASRILTGIFIAMIGLPLPLTLWQASLGPGTPREEKLAATPRKLDGAGALPGWLGEMRWYFEKRFAFRKPLLQLHGWFKVALLNSTSDSDVLLGKEGWLFLAGENALDYQRHSDPFSDAELTAWTNILEERRQRLASMGIEYLVVVAPNKHTAMARYLPDDLAPEANWKRLDQLAEALNASTEVRMLDLREAFLQAPVEPRLFHKTDTHWNLHGGKLAARLILERLNIPVPDWNEPPEDEREVRGGDLARILGLQSHYFEIDLVPSGCPRFLVNAEGEVESWFSLDVMRRDELRFVGKVGQPSVVLFRDSFGENLLPWLAPYFGASTWKWSYDFDWDLIERDRPTLVVQQMVERKLMTISLGD